MFVETSAAEEGAMGGKQSLATLGVFLSALVVLAPSPVRAQEFVWAKQLGGSARRVHVDTSGNVFTAGSFAATGDFDPGAGTFNLTAAGSGDVFVSKLDVAGNFVWPRV
jgi:hypothetical protein